MAEKDGQNYAPEDAMSKKVVGEGDFVFAVTALDHGHIFGMTGGLKTAGGQCKSVFEPDPEKRKTFLEQNPEVKVASCLEEVLEDEEIQLVAAAAVPNLRGPLGLKVMDHGKDYFTDKTPFTTMQQLEDAKAKVQQTKKKYAVCYSERLQNESAIFADQLIKDGAIGKVIQFLGVGPHRLNAPSRPDWFFKKEQYGGIITDIGSHQAEQFLTYTGARDAEIKMARVANMNNPDTPELEDFGEFSLVGDNGCSGYFRMDWFTPEGLRSWGDGRSLIIGTEGYIELRKYINIADKESVGDHVFLVNQEEEKHFEVNGKVGFPYFGELILDCLNRTENAMTQEHTFKAAELCLQAQTLAENS